MAASSSSSSGHQQQRGWRGEWDVGGLAGGTHLLRVTLPPGPRRWSVAPTASVLFDTIEPPPAPPAIQQHDVWLGNSSSSSWAAAVAQEEEEEQEGGSKRRAGVVRVSVLTPNLDANSQTLIFLRLLLLLPRHRYRPTVITASLPPSSSPVLSQLVSAGIPVLHVCPSPCSMGPLLAGLASASCPSDLHRLLPCQPSSLQPLLRHLGRGTDVVLSANTLGLPSSSLLLHAARLAGPRPPLSVLELPNLHPPLDPAVLPCPHALVAPSLFAATHPSVAALRQHCQGHTNSSSSRPMPVVVIPPAALPPPSQPPLPPPPSCPWPRPSTASLVVGYVGRLAPDRSPGLFVLAAHRVRQALLAGGGAGDEVAFVMIGDGPLRRPLQQLAANLSGPLGSLAPLVHLVGGVPRRELGGWYGGCLDVVVNAKQAETFGIANAEAAAHGWAARAREWIRETGLSVSERRRCFVCFGCCRGGGGVQCACDRARPGGQPRVARVGRACRHAAARPRPRRRPARPYRRGGPPPPPLRLQPLARRVLLLLPPRPSHCRPAPRAAAARLPARLPAPPRPPRQHTWANTW